MGYLSKTAVCVLAGVSVAALLLGCREPGGEPQGSITRQSFGKTEDGALVDLYTLQNSKGMEARITNYGGIVVSLKVPDRAGKLDDVVLGHDSLADYLKGHPYFGAIVGRYGNRIAKGQFTLGGKTYSLAANNGPNHLHGGVKGFDKVVWAAQAMESRAGPALELSYTSKDGEEGYPGNLSVKCVYTLTEKNELRIQYTATTDKETILNLTHHSYFNLAGAGVGDILNHEMLLNADRFVPVDSNLIPTGELRPVRGTPLDFTKPMPIGARIDKDDEQLRLGKGYDHTWVLNGKPGALNLAARVAESLTGRVLEVYTTEPGVQFYTGNFLDGTNIGKGGRAYKQRYGFCLEPQHYPDSPNKPAFPSVVLKPGDVYKNTIIYRFSTK